MPVVILVLQTAILVYTGILYCKPVKTFEIQSIPNIIIFFASRTSSVISGLYYFCMAVFSLLLLIDYQSLNRFSGIFYYQLIAVNFLYGLAWLINYLFIKKRGKILLLALLNLVSVLFALFYIILQKKTGAEILDLSLPYIYKNTLEGTLLLICCVLLIPLILWHFYAPFAMNWKMWLTERELNVLSEAFIIFFFTGFPICHLFLNVFYMAFYKSSIETYYMLFILMFCAVLSIKLYLWLIYKPQTRYFKSFKNKLLPVLLSLILVCMILFF